MKKILIVEDNPQIAYSLSIRLKSKGYEVLIAQDALSGSTLGVKENPDLLILDFSMPAGNAFTIIERIALRSVTGLMPFIVITAKRDKHLKEKCLKLGAQGFFEKPYNPDELLRTVANALNETGGASGMTMAPPQTS